MTVCPTCYMKLSGDEACPRCAQKDGSTRTQAAACPELEYLRNFYLNCSADPSCPACDESYESHQRGPFDAGHWMANHWHDKHPELHAQHKARVGGKVAA